MKLRFIFILCSFSLCFNTLNGQSFKAYSNAAEQAYIAKDYYSALVFYNTAMEFRKKRIDLVYKAAESARQINAYAKAEEYYQRVVDSDESSIYPNSILHLAEAQQKLGKYELARNNYAVFIADNPQEEDAIEMAKLGMNACQWAMEIDSSPTTQITQLGTEINTPYSEFAANRIEDDLIFSSMRYNRDQDELKLPDQLYSKILQSSENAPAEVIETFDKGYDMYANSVFNKDKTIVYYTKCRYINTKDIRCQIFSRTINGDEFGIENPLPEYINLEGSTSTHPAIGMDKDGQEWLFFVSDRSGGKGKLDIWQSKI
ncbi:MAG: hypothetical protein AAGK97_17895, partial [Bacteroidota bacterium]